MKGYQNKIKSEWKVFRNILLQYPEIFPKKYIDYGLFLNIYGLVYTRCFGSGVPSTSLVPMADNFNHDFIYVSFQFINLTS